MKRTCKQCGKEFIITQSEINFYKSKNLSIPKRCKECRESNKQNNRKRNESAMRQESYAPSQSPRQKKGTPVTTAVTIALVVFAIIYAIFFKDDAGSPTSNTSNQTTTNSVQEYEFRNDDLLQEHYEKHGKVMGFASAEDYEEAASDVVENEDALRKTEAEDGDLVYYIERTNEFVIVSPDGYIRTYFLPEDGIDYYNRQ